MKLLSVLASVSVLAGGCSLARDFGQFDFDGDGGVGMDGDTTPDDAALPPDDATPPADAAPGPCAADERVASGACVACPTNSTNDAGDDPTGADTACDCDAGFSGDGETACEAILCDANERVQGNACVACPANSTNAAGDDASGADTVCDCDAGFGGDGISDCVAGACNPDERVQDNACVACPANSTNAGGDDSTGADTTCDCDPGYMGDGISACTPVVCPANERVQDNACVACPSDSTNAAGDDASGANTSCECDAGYTGDGRTSCTAISCMANRRVQNNACVACPPNSTNAAGDDASGANTSCDCDAGYAGDGRTSCTAISCMANRRVQNNACVACPPNSTNAAGDDASGGNTACDCNSGFSGDGISACAPVCGDSMVVGGEACDDGNTVDETSCPYGTATCTGCRSDCSAILSLTGPFCGDGVTSTANGEVCDDGVGNEGRTVGDCIECRGAVVAVREIRTSGPATTGLFGDGTIAPARFADTLCGAGYTAMFADGTSRTASVNPYAGDGQVGWPIEPFTAYYNPAGLLVWVTDSTRLLGVRDGAARDLLDPIGISNGVWTGLRQDWRTQPLSTSCNGWATEDGSISGPVGNSGRITGDFIEIPSFTNSCDFTRRVYCVETP